MSRLDAGSSQSSVSPPWASFNSSLQKSTLQGWLTVDDIEALALNLIGVVLVIVGVNFLNAILDPTDVNPLNYGVDNSLRLVGLSYFIFERSRR